MLEYFKGVPIMKIVLIAAVTATGAILLFLGWWMDRNDDSWL